MSRWAQHGLLAFAETLPVRGGAFWRGRRRQGCRRRAYTEVFTACPAITHRPGLRHSTLTIAVQGLVSLLLAASLLAGCGWHLRGSGGSDLEGTKIYLVPEMGEGELASATADTLSSYGAQVVSDRKAADWILVLLEQQTNRRTVSVTSLGQARAYELNFVLRFRVDSGAGAALLGTQTVATQVVYQADPQNILGRESQERRLLEQLRYQALDLMIARLTNIPPETSKRVPERGADSP